MKKGWKDRISYYVANVKKSTGFNSEKINLGKDFRPLFVWLIVPSFHCCQTMRNGKRVVKSHFLVFGKREKTDWV
jgi:hypothetical protein